MSPQHLEKKQQRRRKDMSTQLRAIAIILILLSGLGVIPAQAQDYDLVILNGRVMDPESGLDEVRNVGITDGKIKAVTKKTIKGKKSIDATGHVIAPGFVDGHFHNVVTPFGQKLGLRDGVTSAMELEFGVLPVDEWYDSWEGKAQTNYGATASLQAARETVFNPKFKSISGASISDMEMGKVSHFSMDWSQRIATKDEIPKILALVEEGVKQGALGVGYTPGYMEFGVTTEEGVGAQKIAGKYGLFTAMHGRFSSQLPPSDGVQGTNEQLGSVAAHGGGLIVQHMTAQTLAVTQDALDLIDAAYANGHQVVAEIYPYTYGATMVMADYLKPDNYQKNMGKTYSDIIATATMTPLTKETYENLYKTAPHTNVTFNNAVEADLELALAHPTALIASDAFPYVMKSDGSYAQDWDTPYDAVNGHPRGAGTHAKVLQMVREQNLMPLMLAVSKMSYMYAKYLQDNGVPHMAHKGRIQVGADADIAIFDPNTVKQNATPANGGLPSTGIPYVVVNGTIVVKDSKVLKNVFPGKPIRLPVQQ
jgi:N-acyl-D-glutamate deacylase